MFFLKVEGAVESLSREILTIQAKGDKAAAKLLLLEYAKLTTPLDVSLKKLGSIQVSDRFILFFFIDQTALQYLKSL